MDIDLVALQARWMAHDARPNDVLQINRRVLRAIERGHARSALQRFRPALWGQVALDAAAALIPIAIWVSRRYADTLGRHPIVQQLARDLAGASLNAAHDQLATLAAFEREA